jgi:hypothetical protein
MENLQILTTTYIGTIYEKSSYMRKIRGLSNCNNNIERAIKQKIWYYTKG